jgi:Na+/melibiose symporter-like transporter
MIVVLFLARSFASSKADKNQRVDISSAALSASVMILLVSGLLQSKSWGWITPLAKPEIAGNEIAPLGISLVAYLIIAGLILLKLFYDRQVSMENKGQIPLLSVSMLKSSQLRSGLAVLGSQYLVTASVFFIVPIYLQLVLGYDALETGKKIFPLSLALILFSIIGSKLSDKKSPKQISRFGQYLLIAGSLSLLLSISPDLKGISFSIAMFATGAGLGLLASQLGNINMSAVESSKTSEVGGLQGTIQNLGSSLGTAIIGSVLIGSLTTGFIGRINTTNLSPEIKTYITEESSTGVQIVSADDVTTYALEQGLSEEEADSVATSYQDAQVAGLRESVFLLIVVSTLSLFLSRNIPRKIAS